MTPIYFAIDPVLHDGRSYPPGAVFDANDPAAVAHLLEGGSIAPEGDPRIPHPDGAAGPAGSDPSPEGPGAAASLPDFAEHMRSELAGPVARLAGAEGAISQLTAEVEAVAERLVAAERRLEVPEGTAPPPASEAAEERGLRLVDAARGIDPQAAGDWTSAGVPTVAALERVTGLTDVTAAERDAAWAVVAADRAERAAEG